ncbi:MAG: nuclear transport factor 2 family protein [Streptosporangiaceae bacterium]
MSAKELVIKAVSEMTVDLDIDAVERYFALDFIQHSPTCPEGRTGLKTLMEHAKSLGVRYRWHRAIGDGEYVVLHSRATGLGEMPVIIFDVYRVVDNKITEHWEAMQPEVAPGMIEGPADVVDLDRTDANRDLVREMIEKVFIGAEVGLLGEYFHNDELIQHDSFIGDGVEALREGTARLVQQGGSVEYQKLHKIVAEGNFVFTLVEAQMGGRPHAFYELFRLENGRIAEHWDVHPLLPEVAPHANGLF